MSHAETQWTFSTDAVGERDRFDFWRHALCDAFGEMNAEPTPSAGFVGRIRLAAAGPLAMARTVTSEQYTCRSARQVERWGEPAYYLHKLRAGGFDMEQRGRRVAARSGDMLLCDWTASDLAIPDRYDGTVFRIPRAALAPLLASPDDRGATVVNRASPAGTLLWMLLTGIEAEAGGVTEAEAALLFDQLTRLVAAGFGAADAQAVGGGVRAGRLRALRAVMQRRLTDPRLTAASAGAELGVSERYVNKLFAATGSSFGETLLGLRLDACRAALIDPRLQARTIADIAYGHGFDDLSRFNRRFKARFGATPREIRRGAA